MTPTTLATDLMIPESTRWRDGRLWFANWGAAEVLALNAAGEVEIRLPVPTAIPFSLDWDAQGRLLVICGRESRLLRQAPDAAWELFADLSALCPVCNEIVVDGRGHIYVNGGAMGGGAGAIILVNPDGAARAVAEDFAFPNGMAVTPDNATLIIAESHASRLTAFDISPDGGLSGRRVWADLGEGCPDGICLDAEGCVWFADVPNQACVRVSEGGQVRDRVDLDRGGFACALGGADGRTLHIAAAQWRGMEAMFDGPPSGRILTTLAPAAGAGWP